MMQALTSPTSPDAYRKETIQTYASGWPPSFIGDLHYYLVDYDLRPLADRVDTGRVEVHILSGEYDTSGTVELGPPGPRGHRRLDVRRDDRCRPLPDV